MLVWKNFNGSLKQLKEMQNACYGWCIQYKDGQMSKYRKGHGFITSYDVARADTYAILTKEDVII